MYIVSYLIDHISAGFSQGCVDAENTCLNERGIGSARANCMFLDSYLNSIKINYGLIAHPILDNYTF